MNKKRLVIILCVVVFVIAAAVVILTSVYPLAVPPNYAPSAGETAAIINSFHATDLNGDEVTEDVFSDYALTMVNIWTTSCSPCLKEMPDLAALDDELEQEGFNVIGIVDDVVDAETGEPNQAALELVQRICEQTGADYTMLIPDQSLKAGILDGLAGYPTTYFIDGDGRIMGPKHFGARTKDEWRETITGLLTELETTA